MGTHIPTTEAEWLEVGSFKIEDIPINDILIRCAFVRGETSQQHNIMIGGIPRETDRQRNLPLVNKLYGLLALELLHHDMSSLLYNQPATGKSGGRWESETLASRTAPPPP